MEMGISAVAQRPGTRQFVKFCIVGASSFVVDCGFFFLFHEYFHIPWVIARTISFTLAVTNGYVWNRTWTFRSAEKQSHQRQYAMFYGVNLVGWALNILIMKLVFLAISHQWTYPRPKPMESFVAMVIASAIVVIWNYFANKHWTFRSPAA